MMIRTCSDHWHSEEQLVLRHRDARQPHQHTRLIVHRRLHKYNREMVRNTIVKWSEIQSFPCHKYTTTPLKGSSVKKKKYFISKGSVFYD